jgi:hypothetical protein
VKGTWVVLGVIVGIIFLATIWSIGNGLTAVGRIRESAQQEADSVLPLILKDWSADELSKNAAPELKENVSVPAMLKMMSELKAKLGNFKSVDKAKIGNFESPSTGNQGGPFMIAPFTALGHFEKGDAVIELKLVRSEGKWRVGNFFVRSK